MRRWPWSAIFASVIGVAALLTLGVWQLQRLQWKNGLIAEIEAKRTAAPLTLAAALALADGKEDMNFRSVTVDGRPAGPPLFLLGTLKGDAAWSVVMPVLSEDGILVLVDRGLVPAGARKSYETADLTAVALTGQAGTHPDPRNAFTPDNEPETNTWYWWDIPAMLGAVKAPDGAKVAPFILHAAPGDGAATEPTPLPATAHLRNNHLGYALTWLGLALALVAVSALFIRKRIKVEAARGRR